MEKITKFLKVGGRMGIMGRPKAEISLQKAVTVRLTKFEFEKIKKISEKLQITKTESILLRIDLLEKNKPQRMENIKELLIARGKHFDDDDD